MEISKNSILIYSDIEKSENIFVSDNVKTDVHCWFDYYPRVYISGRSENSDDYFFAIIRDGNKELYGAKLSHNMFSSAFKRGIYNCIMEVYNSDGILISEFRLYDYLKTGKVYISIDSSSLGDTIAWVPYIEEFRKKYGVIDLTVTTFYNELFDSMYPEIKFKPPGHREPGTKVVIGIGWYEEDDRNIHINDPRSIPLQKVCSDILGVDYIGEIRPKINRGEKNKIFDKKYVCIATESTAGSKFWHYPGGWQRLVDLLKFSGYEVVVIQKGETQLKGVVDKSGDFPLEDRISDLLNCDFFIGLSSGLSWLSWGLGIPTVMISGFTDPFLEFSDKCLRIINKNVCHGCFTNTKYKFDRGDWWWCPLHKGTERAFECTKTIKPEDVYLSIIDWVNSNYTQNSF